MEIKFKQIGIIHSPFLEPAGMPIQPAGAEGTAGTVEIFKEYIGALKDLDGFSHIYLLYFFHKSKGWKSTVIPFMDQTERGLFSTRAPRRPNPLGLSLVKLTKIQENTLHVKNMDILNGTPLLDIKPFNPAFNPVEDVRIGWMEKRKGEEWTMKSDSRFSKK